MNISLFISYFDVYGCLLADHGESREAMLELFIGRDVVCHFPIIVLLISREVKVSRTGEAEYDRFFLAGLFAFQGLVYSDSDRVAALRSREDAFDLREFDCGIENARLLDGAGFHQSFMIEL